MVVAETMLHCIAVVDDVSLILTRSTCIECVVNLQSVSRSVGRSVGQSVVSLSVVDVDCSGVYSQ